MRKKTYLKLVDYQTEQSEKHLNEVRSIHKEMRGYKHDFHHHLQTLKGQLEAGEIERALAYIEQLDTQLMLVDTLLKTGNVSLDAILSAKIAQAKAEAITVTVKANVPDILTISDLELSIVIGNLLDNAIESCRTITGERFIRIFISMKGTMLYFSMLNTAGPKKKKTGSLFATHKDGVHGFGLRRADMAAGSSTTVKTVLLLRNFWCQPSSNLQFVHRQKHLVHKFIIVQLRVLA